MLSEPALSKQEKMELFAAVLYRGVLCFHFGCFVGVLDRGTMIFY
jgi:hypothetical protein